MHRVDLMLYILYSTIGTLLICLIGFLLACRLRRVLQVKADRDQSVLLENQGNCCSIYYLEVKSPEPALRFTLFLNKLPLAPVYLPVESDDLAQTSLNENLPHYAEQSGNKPSSAASSGVDTVAKTGRSVSTKAGKFASLFEQIGNILPGSLGTRLKQEAASARKVQTSVLRSTRTPQKVRRQVSGFQVRGSGGGHNSSSPQFKVGASYESYFVQTPVVEPGESLNLTLRVGSRYKRYPQGSFSYTIEALPVSIDIPGLEATPSLKNGTVSFKPVESWRYFLPALSTITLSLMTLISLVFLYRFIWL